jgi:hypothetical protein
VSDSPRLATKMNKDFPETEIRTMSTKMKSLSTSTRILAGIAICVLATTTRVNAVNILSNPIDTAVQTDNPFTGGQTFDPNITVSGIGHGSGVTPNAATGGTRYNMQNWAASLDANDYFTFTLTPNSGYEIDFNNLTGQWQRSGTGPNSYIVKTSLDSFGASVASGSIGGNGSQVGIGPSPATTGIDLSSIQNVTSAIEIRVYAFGNGASAGTFSFNNFTFDGSVNQVTVAGPNINPANTSVNFPNRIVNVAATQAVTLNEVGGANAPYTSSTTGTAVVTSGGSGTINANQTSSITVGINTTSAGTKNGSVTINDNNPDDDQISVSGNVFDHSSAAFLSNPATSLTLNVGSFAQGSGQQSIIDSLYNKLQTVGFTAELDLDSVTPVSGNTSVLTTSLTAGAFTALGASDSESLTPFPFTAFLDTNNAPGTYVAQYQLALSDADSYVGAGGVGSQTLTLNLTGTITGTGPVLPGDFNNDGVVNASDYIAWRKNETANSTLANDNGLATQAQRYNLWRTNFGNSASGSGSQLSLNGTAVPEPQSAVLLLLAFVVGFDCFLARRQSAKRTTRFAT